MLSRSFLSAAALVPLLAIVAVLASQAAHAGPSPMVGPPKDYGPYAIGYTYDTIRTTENPYNLPLKTYYPALSTARDARPDLSRAPYPAILWLHGTGGNQESYQGYLVPLCSWGFVVVAIGYSDAYFPTSCDPSVIEDTLDFLETCNANSSRALFGMINASAFGLSGHSAGGGLSLWDGAYVDRIKVVQTLAAAIDVSAVSGIAARFNKPLLLQAGDQDPYTPGSDAAWKDFKCTRDYLRIIGGTHTSGFQGDVFMSFFLYYLSGIQDYREFVYGDYVINRSLAGAYDLRFAVNETGEFYPPTVAASIEPSFADMDSQVLLNGTIQGRYIKDDPRGSFTWHFDVDGYDRSSTNETALWASFGDPIELNATFSYTIGPLTVTIPHKLHLSVRNVAPVAVFTHGDLTVDMDSLVRLDGSATHDTPSDNFSLDYAWDFGDGEPPLTTIEPLAEHTYNRPGAYTVALSVTDRHGASSTATVVVTVVNVPPTARVGITMAPPGPPMVSVFEDEHLELHGRGNDTPTDRQRLKYMWDFGDGTVSDWSSSGFATHTYTKEGNYTAVLSVRDPAGAVTKANLTVMVLNVAPTSQVLSPSDSASFDEDYAVSFRGKGSDTPSDVDSLSYRWEFGDGNATDWGPVSSITTDHAYARSGTYVARLTVRDEHGLEGSSTVSLTVLNLPPTATIARPGRTVTVDEDSTLAFEGTGTDTPSDQALLVYTWSLDGGSEVTGTTAEYAFPSAGAHVVILTVTDPEGESATATVEVSVVNLPPTAEAAVSPLSLKAGHAVNFTSTVDDTPSDRDGLVVLWSFGDGDASASLSGNHTYKDAGNYTVTLSVTDHGGLSVTKTFKVQVEAPPPAQITPPGNTGGGKGALGIGRTAGIGIVLAVIAVVIIAFLLLRKGRMEPTESPDAASSGYRRE